MTEPIRASTHSALAARIGVARVDITPPVGIYARNWGAAMHDVATAIHRPLTLTAMVISSQAEPDQPLVIIDADLGWWKTPGAFTRVQAELLQQAGVDASRLIFALSHTHAGPPLMDPDLSLPGSELIQPWMDKMIARARNAIATAQQNAVDAVLEWHTGRCQLAAYRDLPDPDATRPRIVCGYNPQGMADDTLLLGRVSDMRGRVIATLVNYACHPTTLAWDNVTISPDYVGAMRDSMEKQTGAPALFLQGASGELAPREQYVGDPAVADRHGRQLAYAALATLEDMDSPGASLRFTRVVESGAPLAVWSQQPRQLSHIVEALQVEVQLPLKDWPTADALERERAAATDRAIEERLRRKRDIRLALGDGSTYSLPVTVWRLGDAVLVGSCCEAYSQFQLDLRRAFESRAIVCMNLVNGSMGYLPPAPLYDQDLYQVWQTPFAAGSLELLSKASIRSIQQLLQPAKSIA